MKTGGVHGMDKRPLSLFGSLYGTGRQAGVVGVAVGWEQLTDRVGSLVAKS